MSGYFAIGAYHPKTEANIGTLWRSTWTYGGAMIATVGKQRYRRQSSDTTRTPQNIPLVAFDHLDDLIAHLPFGCELVGVELDPRAEPLHEFTHPKCGFYLLGAEDHGLPMDVLDRCHRIVQIPAPHPQSLNVATAGTVLLADRYMKKLQRKEALA